MRFVLSTMYVPGMTGIKKFDAVAEDQPGCDCWFKTIAANVNQELGTSIDVETVSSLPHGDERCERIFREKG